MKKQKSSTKEKAEPTNVIQFPLEKLKKQIEKEVIEICIRECKDMGW